MITEHAKKALEFCKNMTELWSVGGDIGREDGFLVRYPKGGFRLFVDAWIEACVEDASPEDSAEAYLIALKRAKNMARRWRKKYDAAGVWNYGADSVPFAVTWGIWELCPGAEVFAMAGMLRTEDIIDAEGDS